MQGGDGNQEDQSQQPRAPPRPLEEITCFKCGTKGHYANKCPKGHLAFLSNNQHNNQHYNKPNNQPPFQQQNK